MHKLEYYNSDKLLKKYNPDSWFIKDYYYNSHINFHLDKYL